MQTLPILHFIDCPNPGGAEGTHRMAYWEWPNPAATKTVVCVHGLTRQGRDFDLLAGELAKQYRVLSVDVAGRGRSGWLPEKKMYHYGTYVGDMVYFLESLGVKGAYWVGTSMGGLIGITLASAFPDYIAKLVVNDIGPHMPEEALRRIAAYVGQPISFNTPEEAIAYTAQILSPWGIKDAVHWKHMAEHSFVHQDGRYISHYDPGIREAFAEITGDIALWEIWEPIQCPVLVLRGENSDLLLPATYQRMLTKKGVEGVQLPGIGHAPSLMTHDQILKVKTWLGA